MSWTRRSFLLGGGASLFAGHALGVQGALGAEGALRPRPRPGGIATAESLDAIFGRSGLSRLTGFVLVDLDSGATIESEAEDVLRPPASVQKIVTALYAHEALGSGYRFATRLLATGPVIDGRLAGDLVLAGDGDPVLDTDRLGALAAAARAGGLATVEGRLLVSASGADGTFPVAEAIDAPQPPDAAYNPSLSGINLNFNRAFASWKAAGKGLAFTARGEAFEVPLTGIRGEASDAALPSRRVTGDAEVWSLPRAGMRRAGSMWLPVARPARYAGEVFRGLAGQRGLVLPQAEVVGAAPQGALVATTLSPDMTTILRDMLRFSTNLTAEVVGLRASEALGLAPADMAASAMAMARWAEPLGLGPAHLLNHSGLSGDARITPGGLARFLRSAEASALPELMPPRQILADDGRPAGIDGVTVRVKTGTIDFASGLAGYLLGKRRLAFAILAADPELRAALGPTRRTNPPGSVAWTRRARRQEQALLRRWARLYAG